MQKSRDLSTKDSRGWEKKEGVSSAKLQDDADINDTFVFVLPCIKRERNGD